MSLMKVYAFDSKHEEPNCESCKKSCCCLKQYKWCVLSFLYISIVFIVIGANILNYQIIAGIVILTLGCLGFLTFLIIYCIQMRFSHTSARLDLLEKTNLLRYLELISYQPPLLKIRAECYRYITKTNKKGVSRKEKNKTYVENRYFKYKYWKDISGVYNLDNPENLLPSTAIRLNTKLEIIFLENDGTEGEYKFFKDEIIFRLQYLDVCFILEETQEIPYLRKDMLVKPTDHPSDPILTKGCFICCFLLLFSECYKIILGKTIFVRDITFRRVISSFTDLFSPEMNSNNELKVLHQGNTYFFNDVTQRMEFDYFKNETRPEEYKIGPPEPSEIHKNIPKEEIENPYNLPQAPIRDEYLKKSSERNSEMVRINIENQSI